MLKRWDRCLFFFLLIHCVRVLAGLLCIALGILGPAGSIWLCCVWVCALFKATALAFHCLFCFSLKPRQFYPVIFSSVRILALCAHSFFCGHVCFSLVYSFKSSDDGWCMFHRPVLSRTFGVYHRSDWFHGKSARWEVTEVVSGHWPHLLVD